MAVSTDVDAVATELQLVLGQLVRRLRAEATVPIPQLRALGWLDREGAATTSRLAALERIRPQSMAQTVTELEAAGLVSKRPDAADRRQTLIELTERGAEQLAAFRRSGASWVATAIERELGPREQRTLAEAVELLRRIASA